jgi:hypothetical protein
MSKHISLTLLSSLGLAAFAFGNGQGQEGSVGPDVAVSGIASSINEYSVVGSERSYSFASTSCNVGTERIDWISGNGHLHPVIAQNMFRVTEGRITQLGYSFLKHSFFALSQPNCTFLPCQGTNGSELGIGCADTYGAGLNDGGGGGSKRHINAATGHHSGAQAGPTGVNGIRGRLRVPTAELNQPGSNYVVEIQYVSEEDQMAGLSRNNSSWREINMTNPGNLSTIGPVRRYNPGIFAWQHFYPNDVIVEEVVNLDEAGPGIHGYFFVAFRSTALAGGLFRYEYAIQNMTSDQSAREFSIPVACAGVNITDPYFHDVDSHSGDPWSTTDWTFDNSGGQVTWSTETFANDQNANALRWGTMYNFGFTADSAPGMTQGSIGLFKPGMTNALSVDLHGPCGTPVCGSYNYCTSGQNSSGGVCQIAVSGSTAISDNNLVIEALGAVGGQPGLFFYGPTQVSLPFGNGTRCVGGGVGEVQRLTNAMMPSIFGDFTVALDFTTSPLGIGFNAVAAGDTQNFQCWYRDPAAGGGGFNLSNATSITFCP